MKKKLVLTLASLGFFVAYSIAAVMYSTPLDGMELEMGNLLNWETSNEENTDLFNIEKSTDGISFKHIGTVKALGNTNKENAYRYLDVGLGAADKIYYRLKVVDVNGTSSYSRVLTLSKTKPNQFAVVAYSSALADKTFDITIDALTEGQLEYELVSYQGDLVFAKFQYLYAGLNELQVSLEDVTEGIFKVKLRLDQEEEVLVIQKASDELAKKVNMASTKKINRN